MKQFNYDDFMKEVARYPFSEWVLNTIKQILDSLHPVNEQPEIIWQCKIPLNPRTKKNSQKIVYNQRTHHSVIVQNEIYKQYEKDCKWFMKAPEKPISGPVNIECKFYRETAVKCDLTNLLEAIDDILVKYKIIADDNYNVVAAHDGSRVDIDREYPRTEITITRLGGRR